MSGKESQRQDRPSWAVKGKLRTESGRRGRRTWLLAQNLLMVKKTRTPPWGGNIRYVHVIEHARVKKPCRWGQMTLGKKRRKNLSTAPTQGSCSQKKKSGCQGVGEQEKGMRTVGPCVSGFRGKRTKGKRKSGAEDGPGVESIVDATRG